MAIIRTARRNSGAETVLKILSVLTEDIELIRGKILMSQFHEADADATKLSLFIMEDNFSYIGARNVWIRDVHRGIAICYADDREATDFLRELKKEKKWDTAFPPTHQYYYDLKELDKAAHELRNYLLMGALPSIIIPDWYQERLNNILKKIEWDVLGTFDPYSLNYKHEE